MNFKEKEKTNNSELSANTVKKVIVSVADLNRKDRLKARLRLKANTAHPIFDAICAGDEKNVLDYVNKDKTVVNKVAPDGPSPLVVAIMNGNLALVKLLVTHGANKTYTFQFKNKTGAQSSVYVNPLQIAVIANKKEIYQYLSMQYDQLQDEEFILKHFQWLILKEKNFEYVDILLSSGNLSFCCLVIVYYWISEILKEDTSKFLPYQQKIFARLASLIQSTTWSEHIFIDLTKAINFCVTKNVAMDEVSDFIFNNIKEVLNEKKTKLTEQLLYDACNFNQEELVKFLIKKAVDIELPTVAAEGHATFDDIEYLPTITKASALYFSVVSGQGSIVKILLSYNADINARVMIYKNNNLSASKAGHKVAKKLKESSIFNGSTSLMQAVRLEHYEIFEAILERNPDLDAQDCSGRTALMYAVQCNNIMFVEKLLAKGANTEIENDAGKTALDMTENTHMRRLLNAESAVSESKAFESHDKSLAVADSTPPILPVTIVSSQSSAGETNSGAAAETKLTETEKKLTPLTLELQKKPDNKFLQEVENYRLLLSELLDIKVDDSIPKVIQVRVFRNAMLGSLARMLRALQCYTQRSQSDNAIFPVEYAKKLANVIFHAHDTKLAKVLTNITDNEELNKQVKSMVKVILNLMDDSADSSQKTRRLNDLIAKPQSNNTKELWQQLFEHVSSVVKAYHRLEQGILAKQDLKSYESFIEKIPDKLAEYSTILAAAQGYTAARLNAYLTEEMLELFEELPNFKAIKIAWRKGYLFRHPENDNETIPQIIPVVPGTAASLTTLGVMQNATQNQKNSQQAEQAPVIDSSQPTMRLL